MRSSTSPDPISRRRRALSLWPLTLPLAGVAMAREAPHTAAWPGATAEEMQAQVADRLEKRLQELDYYDRVETIAQPGFVSMRMTYKESTRPSEIQDLFYQTRKKLSDEAARLPKKRH